MVNKLRFRKKISYTFIKAQLSSLASTLGDFLLTSFFTETLGVWYLLSSSMVTILGGCVNFLLGRYWVFNAIHNHKFGQAKKYLIVWAGSLILNSLVVYLFTELLQIYYMLSKILVAILVGVIYNYYYQKTFVFETQNEIIQN